MIETLKIINNVFVLYLFTRMFDFLFIVCFVCQDAGSVFQVNACVSPASQAKPATVPSPRKPACRMTDRYAAVWESVCVAGVCVMTPSAPGRSVRSVTPATAPVCLTGNLSLSRSDVIDWFDHLSINSLLL